MANDRQPGHFRRSVWKQLQPASLFYLVDFSIQRIVVSRAKVGASPLFYWSGMALSFSP